MKYCVAQRDTKSKGLPDIVSVVGSKMWRHNVFGLTESPELRYRDVTDRQRRIAGTPHWAASVWLSHGPSGGARPGNVGMPKVPGSVNSSHRGLRPPSPPLPSVTESDAEALVAQPVLSTVKRDIRSGPRDG